MGGWTWFRRSKNAQQGNKETNTNQEQKQEQHLPIRHADRPADSLDSVWMCKKYRCLTALRTFAGLLRLILWIFGDNPWDYWYLYLLFWGASFNPVSTLWSYTAVWCHDSGWFHCSWVCSARKVPTQQLVDRCVFRPCRSLQTQTTFFRGRYDLWQSELWTYPKWNAAWLAAASQTDVVFFAVEHIDVLMFGFGCWGETAESAKNVMFLEIRPNIFCVSASDLIRRCGRA